MAEERKQISLDEHLSAQASSLSAFLGTVELIPTLPDSVKITPWLAGPGCLCQFSFNVPRSAIASLTTTGIKSACCGQSLNVVEITFVPTYSPVADAVGQQVRASRPQAQAATRNLRRPISVRNRRSRWAVRPFDASDCDVDCMDQWAWCYNLAGRMGGAAGEQLMTLTCDPGFANCYNTCVLSDPDH
jgi:hypothetical protein